jgi:hypothetical protein
VEQVGPTGSLVRRQDAIRVCSRFVLRSKPHTGSSHALGRVVLGVADRSSDAPNQRHPGVIKRKA